MKLEFESNAVSSPLVGNHVPAEFDEHHSSPEVLEMLREGIKSAQDGERAEARNLLLRVTETDPRNENAWLWLASISEYPEELLVFLNNVLQINPENERALEWAKATKSLIAKTFVQRGIDAAKDEQKKFAKQCFLQAIVHDSNSELAYLWLASVSDSTEEKMSHLQKVLSINPENENAASSLKNAKENKAKALLPKANTAAISGKRDVAHQLLQEIFADAPDFEDAWMLKAHISESFDDKIEAFERVLEINPENPVARANVDSLKMFAVNSEAESPVPMPADDFEDSHQLFSPTESFRVPAQEEPAQEEPAQEEVAQEEVVVEMEAAEVEKASDREEFEAKDESSDAVEYHAEEAVPYEDIAPALEAEPESPVQDESLFEGDDIFSLENPEEADEAAESLKVEASEDSQTEVAPIEFGDESFDEEADSVDHDYVEESVDFSGDEDSSEAESMEAADVSVEAPAEDDQHSAESSVEEEVSEIEAAAEEAQDHSMEVQEDSDEVAEEEAEESADFSAEADEDARFEAEAPGEPEMPNFETAESLSPEMPGENDSKHRVCAYCSETNENQAFACHGCKAIFTISDIEMIVSHTKADKKLISKALEKMEIEKSLRGVDVAELKHLGIGYLNLKDYRKGFEYLQEAAKKDPNDVVLISQIDALAVRLAEIEDHERDSEPMTASKRILVVDDSPTVRKLISGKLEKCGHEPICAVDGMDALAKINEEIPDLILLDITMPRMDGYQVCKLIRSNEATKDVPVVMISGKDGFFDKVRGRMAGTSNYITKPFGPETLMKTVNEYIQ